MAFDIEACGGWGEGGLGDLEVTEPTVINSYARISAINRHAIKVKEIPEAFSVGDWLLLQVASYSPATFRTDPTCAARGAWIVAKINRIVDDIYYLNKDVSGILRGFDLEALHVQAINLPEYKNVTIAEGGTLTAPRFALRGDTANQGGGVVAFKCSDTLIFSGGHIDIGRSGFEEVSDYGSHGRIRYEYHDQILRASAGWENHRTIKHLPINSPGGACFILAKNMICHDDSRIGEPVLAGVARQMHTKYNTNYIDARGGSSILLAAENITNFTPDMIAKANPWTNGATTGVEDGWGRCYIATESCLPCDEGLYAYDRISNPNRLSESFNIKSFGDGSDGAKTNYTSQLNNYANITIISSNRKMIAFAGQTSDGLAKFKVGALVMIHVTQKSNADIAGRFILTKILAIKSNKITVADAIPLEFDPTDYCVQIITVPQFTDFTLNKTNSAMINIKNGRGGLVALACSGTCDLSGGQLLSEGKGGAIAYGEEGLNYISNAQMLDKLPIGQGHGSVFILANNLTMNTSTRIGASYTGNELGGIAGVAHEDLIDDSSTWRNYTWQRVEGGDSDASATKGIYPGDAKENHIRYSLFNGPTTGGTRRGGGCTSLLKNYVDDSCIAHGGFGSNGQGKEDGGGKQGAHILIVANKITGFNVAALSTGGQGGQSGYVKSAFVAQSGRPGGCGFGGAGNGCGGYSSEHPNMYKGRIGGNGGIHGGGAALNGHPAWGAAGGASGFCAVYANEVVSPDYSGILID